MALTIASITTYPIKGFAGQTHERIIVNAGELLPGDRAYALSSGTKASQEAEPHSWLKKAHFLQMMNHAGLASLSLAFDPVTTHLRLIRKDNDAIIFDGHLNRQDNCEMLGKITAEMLGLEGVSPRLFALHEGGMTDTKTPYVAFGTSESISDFANQVGIEDDERRFRLNVMMRGASAFTENDLVGKSVQIGTAEFAFIEPVGRCAAIEVDPQTAFRRKNLVQDLRKTYGHEDMGVFASVIKSGEFACGDEVIITSTA